MTIEQLARHRFGDMEAVYRTRDGQVDLVLVPVGLQVVDRRPDSSDRVEGLVQLHVRGDTLPTRWLGGRSMRRSGTTLELVSHQATDDGVETQLRHARTGLQVRHLLRPRVTVLVSTVTLTNAGTEPVTVDLASSFALAGITPYAADDAPERLVLHRWRSSWSLEGRLVSEALEDLHLVPDYTGGAAAERFGQVGTMPTRGWFPQLVVEDTTAGVCWGAQLAWGGSWQLEVMRGADEVLVAGGLADREFGHWSVTLRPGEALETPEARLTVVRGSLDDACDRIVGAMVPPQTPGSEQDLPVIVNEWCTTWGQPTEAGVLATADRLLAAGIRPGYFVIDAGWFQSGQPGVDWYSTHGDWNPSPALFPSGLTPVADALRERGIVPGIWFEAESVGRDSRAFNEHVEHLLHRDGEPLTVGVRRFWDLTDPWAFDHLAERVVGQLRDNGFGYVKIDYNEHLGLGPDHSHSHGEGLRRQVLASHRFFDTLVAAGLVVENCASGGHRLEPSYVERTAMSSFSDAHEPPEIPVIAAALHRLIPPRQSQVWAVLHPSDSPERLRYSLAAGFLGRLCLSGDLVGLSDDQLAVVRSHTDLYALAAPVIAAGVSRSYGDLPRSWRHLQGWQAVVRTADDTALVVAHTFAGAPATLTIPVGDGWRVQAVAYGEAALDGADLSLTGVAEHDARVVLLSR